MESNKENNLGVYLHFPFCVEKCKYCDFLSFGGWNSRDIEAYCKTLIEEIEEAGRGEGKERMADTVFLGGGTPSLIDEALMAEVMQAVRNRFNMAENPEISIETNPKTLTKKKLKAYKTMGINRISMGVQSLDDDLLRFLGRIHTKADFMENFDLARACGFGNINVDLMFAIPGQTLKIWMDTLDRIIDLAPEHISFYSLQLEEGTPFYKLFQTGKLKPVSDEEDREMYHEALAHLKAAGYRHYEISNSAKPGFESKHNLKYWSMAEYVGLGLGAHSYINGVRRSNVTVLSDYASPFTLETHENTRKEDIAEYLFMGLRKREGIDLKDFKKRFGQPVEEVYRKNWTAIERYREEGCLILMDDRLYLTEKGIDISNVILAEFI